MPQILLPPLRKPTELCRVPLPALWSGSLSRQRASPVVAWTSFPPSLGITILPCLMSSVSKTTALCVLRVWFWLLWVGSRRANRSLSDPLGRKWEQSLCVGSFAALCGVSSAFSEVPGKRLQKIKGDSGVEGGVGGLPAGLLSTEHSPGQGPRKKGLTFQGRMWGRPQRVLRMCKLDLQPCDYKVSGPGRASVAIGRRLNFRCCCFETGFLRAALAVGSTHSVDKATLSLRDPPASAS